MIAKQKPRGSVNKLPEYLEPSQIETLIEFAAQDSRIAANFILTMWRAAECRKICGWTTASGSIALARRALT